MNTLIFLISYCDFIRFFWFDIKSILKNITWLFVSYLYMNTLYIILKHEKTINCFNTNFIYSFSE